ncbi:unnamed protein product [Rhodiola kirilowii]
MDRKYDIVILGASGFTGKYVLREALKFHTSPSSSTLKTLAIAIAGRSVPKLTEAVTWSTHPNPPPQIPILTADITDPDSLRFLCAQTKLVLNCVGPFRLYGEPVVKACVESGCDYLDICGEPEFMERMEIVYGAKAAESESLVISACGFDSVPAELGFMFNVRQWSGEEVVNCVEAYVSLESDKRLVGNFGTFESAVLGVANADKLQKLRRSRPRRTPLVIPGPKPSKGPVIEHQKKLGLWAVKLPSADATVVRRTLVTLAENPDGLVDACESDEYAEKIKDFWSTVKPAYFGVKMGNKSLLGILRVIAIGISLGIFGSFSLGRWLLLKFPLIFSFGMFRKQGPTEDEVSSASFKMWFVGHGFSSINAASQANAKPDLEIVTRVMGPEVGYITTPIILLQCAIVLLSQRKQLPKGGVLTPGIVFGPTDLQQRLQENGMAFDFISRTKLTE